MRPWVAGDVKKRLRMWNIKQMHYRHHNVFIGDILTSLQQRFESYEEEINIFKRGSWLFNFSSL